MPELNSSESRATVSPFMINRWITMHSPKTATFINETTNKYYSVLNDEEYLKFIKSATPRVKFKKSSYIKKNKKTKSPTKNEKQLQEDVKFLSEQLEISERELYLYIEQYGKAINR